MTSFYQSDDWKSLDLIDRAQLLLVIEGLKKAITQQSLYREYN